MPARPHRLELYQAAVQHPLAEIALIERAYAQHTDDFPLLLREDFAGTAAVAAHWVASHPERQAMAIDNHPPTTKWATRNARQFLDDDADDLHIVTADVLELSSPKVDVTAILNFSIGEHHTRPDLIHYLRYTRRALRDQGMILIDLFGGPGSITPNTQTRTITPPPPLQPFDYHWQQHTFDAATNRIDCRIHFTLADGHTHRNAFRYDWRLWSPAELSDALAEARFRNITLWCDRIDPRTGRADGRYKPVRSIPPREDWIIYLTAAR